MMGKPKRPKVASVPLDNKSSRIAHDPVNYNQLTPVWSIGIFDGDGPWGKGKIEIPSHLWDDIFEKLRNYESMTWGNILADKERNHSVPVSQLIKEAQSRLKDRKLDDVDELFRLRLNGKQRVWGIRDRHILKLLWWDPEHEICPSRLKNT